MATAQRHFNASYQETAELNNGVAVVLRLVQPEDKDMLVRGLDRLSPRSRYLRFFTNKQRLTPAELQYLTEVDGENHFALGATRPLPDGTEEGVGIARFVRRQDDLKVAEAAIVVTDDFHHNGLGRLLFLRLVAAARERGIERFRSEVLAENKAMRAIVHKLATGAHEQLKDGVITVDADLPTVEAEVPADTPSARGTHYRLLALVAEDALKVRPPSSDPFGTPHDDE